jgi:hypothetical protein
MKRLFLSLSTMIILSVVVLPGCGGGGGGGGVTDDIEVTLSTAGGATTVAPGATLTVKANVVNASDMNVTWSLSGTTCPNNCGTITPTTTDFADYKAPYSTEQYTVTITATSVQNPAKSGSVVLTVLAKPCLASASLMNGQYAFLMQGFSNGTGSAMIGSLTADGCGNITGGSVDYYFGPGAAGYAVLSGGSYTIGADHRGTLTLSTKDGSKNFAIALGKINSGVASTGGVTETAPSINPVSQLSGSLWLQDPAAFALSKIAGPYAFLFNGWNAYLSYGPREALGGTVTADGAGHFNTGLVDDKVYGASLAVTTSWNGTYGAPSNAGRTALSAPVLTGATGSAVLYVVDASNLIAMIWDTSATGRVFSGSMLAQQAGTFSAASLKGNIVCYQTANYWPGVSGYETLTMSVLTLVSPDGAGNMPYLSRDVSSGGNIYHLTDPLIYTYTVDANGQVSVNNGSTVGGKFYLMGPNTGLLLGFDYGVSIGMCYPQSAGILSAASISGNYVVSQAPGGSVLSKESSGIATSDGDGILNMTLDVNYNGYTPDIMTSVTLTTDSQYNGRVTDSNNNVIYMVSPSRFFMMSISSAPDNYAPVVQTVEQ